jgi:hypothetical protein
VSIYSYESFLEFGQFSVVAEQMRPLTDSHISHCYEKNCDGNSCRWVQVSRQWGKNDEIDVAGINGKNELECFATDTH